MARTIKLGTQYREASLDASTLNEDNRTVELAFSSEFPVEREFVINGQRVRGWEVLDHTGNSADLSRLNNKGPVLLDHESKELVGVVESARIDSDKVGRAIVRFSKSARGEETFTEIKDGIRNHVSFGYQIKDMELEGQRDGLETFRVTRYQPFEISMVGVPADPTVGVGRSYELTLKERSLPMSEPTSPETPPKEQFDAEAFRNQIRIEVENEHKRKLDSTEKRNAEIEAIAVRGKNEELTRAAEQFKKTDRSIDEFRKVAFDILTDAKPFEVEPPPSEGMSKRDLSDYSITRAIMQCVPKQHGGLGTGLDGLEKELSEEVEKRTGRRAEGFFIPSDVVHKRVLEVGTFTGAGALVTSNDGGQSLIELLRNNMAVVEMGATVLSGLEGDVDIPRQTGGGTANWLAEGAALSRADQTVGQLALRPHRLAAATAFSKQLLAQASPDVESFVRNDLMQVIAIAKDLAATGGSGVSGQPLGIINTSNLSSTPTHTSGDTFTWAMALEYEEVIEAANALRGNLGFLMSNADKQTAKSTSMDSGSGKFVWDIATDTINGYKAMSSTQITASSAGGVIFGNWSDLIIADWDGMDVVVDPYSLSLNGQISIVIQTLTDIGVRIPASFTISN